MGHVRSRFFTHLPANTPVRPQKIPCKSFRQRILPATHTRSVAYAQNPANVMKTRNFGGRGEGVSQTHSVPLWETTRGTSTQLPATSYQLPLMPSAIARQLLHDVPHKLLGVAEEHEVV